MKSLEELEKALTKGMKAWENEIIEKHGKRMGQKIIREIKRETPVDSGNLRRRWDSSVDRKNGEVLIKVSNDADYSASVNNGHRIVRGGKTVGKTKGFHMLEKGILTYQDKYAGQDVKDMLSDLQKGMK